MPPVPPPPPPTAEFKLPIEIEEPKCPLKPLAWTKFMYAKDNSVWKKIHLLKHTTVVNFAEIEKKFQCKENFHSRVFSSVKAMALLNHEKETNIGIIITSLHKSPEELAELIKQGSTDVFTAENYQSLRNNLPDEDEEKTLLEYSSTDSSKLSKCDYFMVHLVKIPDYKTWLDVLIIKSQFDIFDEIRSNLKVRLDKCEVLLTSESFPIFLRYVLEVGLFMNKGKGIGLAAGFKIYSLKQLNFTKSSDNKHTLLEILISQIEKSDADTLQFVDQFLTIGNTATRFTVKEAKEEFQNMKKKVVKISDRLEGSDWQTMDQCIQFKQVADEHITKTEEIMKCIEERTAKVSDYFSEDIEDIDEFFDNCKEMCEEIRQIKISRTRAPKRRQITEKTTDRRCRSVSLPLRQTRCIFTDELESKLKSIKEKPGH